MKALVVDDNYWTAVTTKEIFEIKGIETECSFNSSDAINKIKNNHYDYVLLDIIINGDKENGIDIYNIIQEKEENTKVIFITGCNSDTEYAKTANELAEVVYKDFSPSGLADRILEQDKQCQTA